MFYCVVISFVGVLWRGKKQLLAEHKLYARR